MVVGSLLGSGNPSKPVWYLKDARPGTSYLCFSQIFQDCTAVVCGVLVGILLVGSGIALLILVLAAPFTAVILITAGAILLLIVLVGTILLCGEYREAAAHAAAARETAAREEEERRQIQIVAEHNRRVQKKIEQVQKHRKEKERKQEARGQFRETVRAVLLLECGGRYPRVADLPQYSLEVSIIMQHIMCPYY